MTTRNAIAAIWIIGSTTLGFAFVSAADKRETADAKISTVPFEMLSSNHMVVNAKINGKGPYRLVFDLGAPITLLSNKAAEESGAVKKNAPKSFLFSMRGEGTVDALEVGELKAKDLPVLVFDHPVLKALAGFLGKPLDGIIGFTFFARYKTTIDYQKQIMTFEPVKYEIRDLMKELPNRLTGSKVAKEIVLAPTGFWGLNVADPKDDETKSGITVTHVEKNSPAEAAGVRTGDLLTTLDGRWTTSIPDVYAAAAKAATDQPIEIAVIRDGKELILRVTPRRGF